MLYNYTSISKLLKANYLTVVHTYTPLLLNIETM